MNEHKDRRTFDRRIVPELKAFMINASWYYFLRYRVFYTLAMLIFGKNLIQNLSASGSCILSSNNFAPGKTIFLFLSSPSGRNMYIKGTVRWISPDTGYNMYYTGIQFLAYGNGKKYNSFKVRKQLHIYTLPDVISDSEHSKLFT